MSDGQQLINVALEPPSSSSEINPEPPLIIDAGHLTLRDFVEKLEHHVGRTMVTVRFKFYQHG
jgi:hypothetical protein